MRHTNLINEQMKQERKLRELDVKQQWRDDKLVHFPFTHGD